MFPPPPVRASARSAASSCSSRTAQNLGAEALYQAMQALLGQGLPDPELAGVFSSYQINVPQLDVDVDRVKVKRRA